MNCKPGDLAIVVSARSVPEMVGRYVIVLSPAVDGQFTRMDPSGTGVTWMIRSASGGTLPAMHPDGSRTFLLERPYWDGALKPIRDPGDDAVDESKAWLPPAPLPTIEPHLLEVGK